MVCFDYRLSKAQALLLKAALLTGQPVHRAWEQWKSQVDIENLDDASYALLPQLYQNLLTHQVEDAHIARLKGIYRRTWYANRLQIKEIETLIIALIDAGIQIIVLGDVAISAYYQNSGTRSISSFNLLVQSTDMKAAIAVLSQFDWYSAIELYESQLSVKLHNQQQQQPLWLQQHLFWAIPQAQIDKLVWRSAVPSHGWGTLGLMLNPTDQFLDVCAKTFLQGRSHQIQEIADAMVLLAAVDWSRLVAQAQRYRLILPLSTMLLLLQSVLQVSIPNWVLPTLRRTAIAPEEWLNYQVWAGDWQFWLRSRFFYIVRRPFMRLKSRLSSLKRQMLQPQFNPLSD